MESILTSIKKLLGISEEYTPFDADIIIHINSAFMVLNQLGVGPTKAFFIEDETATWRDFASSDTNLEGVKTYIYLKVKIVFDPPSSSFVLDSMKRQIEEFEWRLHIQSEGGT